MNGVPVPLPGAGARPRAQEHSRPRAHLPLVWVLGACLAAQLAAGLPLARTHGFWSPDSAVRYLQVEGLLASRYRDLSVPYPARALDPVGRYFPLGGWFHFERGGRFYVSYQPYFSLISAPLVGLFGFGGLLLIPAISVLVTVGISYGVVRSRVPHLAWPSAAALGLATPLLVYGVVFWDHSLTVLVATGALALLAAAIEDPSGGTWRLAGAGALLGLGMWFRNEMYPLAASVAVAWVSAYRPAFRRVAALAVGIAPPACALWALNTRVFGHPLGWKGQDLASTRIGGVAQASSSGVSGAAAWATNKLGNAYYQLVSPDFYAYNAPAVAGGLVLAGAVVVGMWLLRSGIRRRSCPAAVAGLAVTVGASLIVASSRTMVSGLFPAAPVVVLAIFAGARARWERFLWIVVALFVVAVILTGTHGGLQWGPRYLLPVLPPLIWLAAAGVARIQSDAGELWPVLRPGLAALAVGSCLLQFSGVDQVQQAASRNARLNAWLRSATAEVVVTPLQWLTLGAGPVYFDREMLLVRSPEDLRELVGTLSARHVRRWTYIPFSGSAFHPRAIAAWTDGREWRFRPAEESAFEGLRAVTYAGFSAGSSVRP